MTCASCGKAITGGARYCIHCGAEQSLPTPIAAVAAAAAGGRTSRGEAANAAHADPMANAAHVAPAKNATSRSANHVTQALLDGRTANDASASPPAVVPAYANLPHGRGLALAMIVICVLIGGAIAAFVGWRVHEDRLSTAATQQANAAAANAPLPAAPMQQAPPAASEVAPSETPTAGATAGSGASSSSPNAAPDAGRPIEIKPLPPRPAPSRVPRRQSEPKESPGGSAGIAVPAPAASPSPPVNRAAAPAAAATPVADRWQRMSDELSRCTREDFIARVICGQRVRFRYCDGYWGKVAQCPANPAPERGQ